MKISIKQEGTKIKFEFHHSGGELIFLSSVDGAEKLIKKLEKVMDGIDGKSRTKSQKVEDFTTFGFEDLLGKFSKKHKK